MLATEDTNMNKTCFLVLFNNVILYNFDFPSEKVCRRRIWNNIYDENAFRERKKLNALKVNILILNNNELILP